MPSKNRNYNFYAVLSANIEFSDSEFQLICEHASHHYDSTVKSLVKPGGFLYGEKGSRDFAKSQLEENPENDLYKDYKYRLYESRDIQLMLKAIEFSHSAESAALYYRIHKILKEMYEKQSGVNEILLGNADE